MTQGNYHKNLEKCRAILAQNAVDGFVLSTNDAFFSEYPPEHFKRLQWLTGFSGSAGTVLLLSHKAVFFTDGRYTLQASKELDAKDYEVVNSGVTTPAQWAGSHASGQRIGFDPWLVSQAQLERWKQDAPQVEWVALAQNPIDTLWQAGRAELSEVAAFDYPVKYAGKSRDVKRQEIAQVLEQKSLDAVLLTTPESVCWLLNLRARDVEATPVFLSRAILYADGRVDLFAPEAKLPKALQVMLGEAVTLYPEAAITEQCRLLAQSGKKILADSSTLPVALAVVLEHAAVPGADPCVLPRALKNDTELANIAATHTTDGRALTGFLQWLDGEAASPTSALNEFSLDNTLLEYRQKSPDFIEPSFPTIAGFGPNGAIVHYRAAEGSALPIKGDGLLLVDSGGQYWGGTTDVTRTVAIGTPSDAMKANFTRVLKGHIALANAVFPKGTTGAQLDVLARQYLWQAGLDYDHGTGHGVGCFLGVHEGPQGISKRYNSVALQPGMILSNEPGYYKTGEYGIRIENLVVVSEFGVRSSESGKIGFSRYDVDRGQQAEPSVRGALRPIAQVSRPEQGQSSFLHFRTLTCVPMDAKLVVWEMLTPDEEHWWNAYHKWVSQSLAL